MADPLLKTPGERHQTRGTPPRQGVFTLVDENDETHRLVTVPTYSHEGNARGSVSKGHMASFNVDIEDTGDDVLLDWEQYAGRGMHGWSMRIFGKECMVSPPDWWFHLTRGQRRSVLACGLCVVCSTVLLLLVMGMASFGTTIFNSSSTGSIPHVEDACEWMDWRLPGWVRPEAYDLTFQVQMAAPWKVDGSVVIDVDVGHQTRCLVLHAEGNMTVRNVRLSGGMEDGEYVKNNGVMAVDTRFDENLEQVTLEWKDTLTQGKKSLYMEFSYHLRDGMSGFYKSTYLDGNVEETIAATQFEANSARSAFPCFDEPEYKSRFTVEVITAKEYQVLSNMPPKTVHHHETQSENVKTWHFQTTPPMSTYLLALVIGKLQSVQREIDVPKDDVWKSDEFYNSSIGMETTTRMVQVWGIPSQIANLEFAADAAAAIVPFYEDTLKVAYALPKVDLVAIPDFSAGAMENWGLITYRQIALSVSPTSSLEDKRYVTIIIAHELAHQWFGNLVTMSWWNDLWLNEGFASYFEYLGATSVHPEMSFLDDFYIDNLPLAFDFDGKEHSHSLSMGPDSVRNSSSIEGVFDAIEYQKGASILRMLRAWMNRDIMKDSDTWEADASSPDQDMFLRGLHEYLIAHAYSNSSALALWESVEGPSEVDLIPLMNEWTFMDGFPLVTVSVDGKGSVTLKQQKFSDSADIPCQTENLWWIPTGYISSESATKIKWGELNSCQSLRPLTTISKNGWIKVNALQYGYYRVNYSPQLWTQLHNAVQQYDTNGFPALSGIDVAGLIEDSFHVAGHGDVTMDVFLTFVESLGTRPVDDSAPWMTALPYMKRIHHLVSCKEEWVDYVNVHVLAPFIENGTLSGNLKSTLTDFFTFSSNTLIDGASKPVELQMLRPAILEGAGYYGISAVRKEAEQIFKNIASGKKVSLDSDLRSAMYNTVAKTNNKKYMEDMVRLLKSAENADESERIIRALSIFDQGDDVLHLSLESLIRPQDVGILLESFAINQGNAAGMHLLEWLQDNHMNMLFTKLGSDTGAGRKLARMLERISAHINDERAIDIYKSIPEKFADIFVDEMPINRAIEAVQSNSRWVKTHGQFVCEWIKTPHT